MSSVLVVPARLLNTTEVEMPLTDDIKQLYSINRQFLTDEASLLGMFRFRDQSGHIETYGAKIEDFVGQEHLQNAVDYKTIRTRIRDNLYDLEIVDIDDEDIQAFLDQLRSSRYQAMDILLDTMSQENDEWVVDIESLTENEIGELASKAFYSWYSHSEYLKNNLKVNPIIIANELPRTVLDSFRAAKQCFVFENYLALFGMLRSTLEVALEDICTRAQLYAEAGLNRANTKPWQMRKLVADGNDETRARLDTVYEELSNHLHGRRFIDTDALEMINQVKALIEELYTIHEQRLRA